MCIKEKTSIVKQKGGLYAKCLGNKVVTFIIYGHNNYKFIAVDDIDEEFIEAVTKG